MPNLNVFGTNYNTVDGTGVRDYIHVVDLAKGHIAALNKCLTPGYKVFNLGTGRGTSVLQLVTAFEKASGITIPLKLTDRRPGDAETLVCVPTRANVELEWTAELSIDEMCKDNWNRV